MLLGSIRYPRPVFYDSMTLEMYEGFACLLLSEC